MSVGSVVEPSEAGLRDDIVLSVVVPVYNQAGSIVENVAIIRQRLEANVSGEVEIIVVSTARSTAPNSDYSRVGCRGSVSCTMTGISAKDMRSRSGCWKRAVDGLGMSMQISTSIQLASVTISG